MTEATLFTLLRRSMTVVAMFTVQTTQHITTLGVQRNQGKYNSLQLPRKSPAHSRDPHQMVEETRAQTKHLKSLSKWKETSQPMAYPHRTLETGQYGPKQ